MSVRAPAIHKPTPRRALVPKTDAKAFLFVPIKPPIHDTPFLGGSSLRNALRAHGQTYASQYTSALARTPQDIRLRQKLNRLLKTFRARQARLISLSTFGIKKQTLAGQINLFLRLNTLALEFVNNANSALRAYFSRPPAASLYTNDHDAYLAVVNAEETKTDASFAALDQKVVVTKDVPDYWRYKTLNERKRREQTLKRFFSQARLVVAGSHYCKGDQRTYRYSLVGFRKKLKKLVDELEEAFWSVEVKKVAVLNRPRKSSSMLIAPILDDSGYVIDLSGVGKYYSNGVTVTQVLHNVNLQLNRGDFIVILGPSGSGKTTLLNIISGMDRATYGKTLVAGIDLMTLSDRQLTDFRRENVGYIFQQYGLLPNLTVKENIEIGAHLQADANKRLDIDTLLADIGMSAQRDKLPSELSGGQQQRVSILRAIAKNPLIIFGDEPTGALDEEMTQIVLEQFVRVNKQYRTTIILVTHNPLIAEIATCVVYVGNGTVEKIVRNNNPKTVAEVKWGGDK